MNWKINYWTILFALAIGAFAYNYLMKSPNTTKSPSAKTLDLCSNKTFLKIGCDTTKQIDTIPARVAKSRIIDYHIQMSAIDSFLTVNHYPLPVENFVMTYAKLRRCELYEMLCKIPNGDVYIYPTIEWNPTIKKNLFSIVLGDTPISPGDEENPKKTVFFDFATPCPPCLEE